MRTVYTPVTSVALILKKNNPAACETGRQVAAWLEARAVPCPIILHDGEGQPTYTIPEVDFVLAFGGDGTMVAVARKLLGRTTPLAGVNFGKVGFLAEISQNTWEQSLTEILQKGVRAEPRMGLRYSLSRQGHEICSGDVINDVVVTRGRLARLVNLELKVNDEPFMLLRSDGLIFSTPTGSTGYCCSAGGPLLLPGIESYVVAAICPFLSSFPPLVLHCDTTFSVTVGEAGTDLFLTLDGQEIYPMMVGDTLTVTGVQERFFLAQVGQQSYFERLRRIGFVQETV